MANPLTDIEAEAIAKLGAGNSREWSILEKYFERMLNFERDQCVDCGEAQVKLHQGRARAFRDAVSLSADAQKKLS